MFWLLLLFGSFVYGCSPMGPMRIDIPSDTSSSDSSEEEIICSAAMEAFSRHKKPSVPDIRDHIMSVIVHDKSSPLVDQGRISQGIVRMRSGDMPLGMDHYINYINDVVMKATALAMEEQEKKISLKQQKIESRFNKKQLTAICGVMTTLMSGIVGIVVNYSRKCNTN